jgi:hypothetical protein
MEIFYQFRTLFIPLLLFIIFSSRYGIGPVTALIPVTYFELEGDATDNSAIIGPDWSTFLTAPQTVTNYQFTGIIPGTRVNGLSKAFTGGNSKVSRIEYCLIIHHSYLN